MEKKYIVRLSSEEREILIKVIKKLKGGSEKVKRAQILLKADIESSNWTDEKIADAFDCSRKTVENVRQRLITEGFEAVLNRKEREEPPRPKSLDGEQEAKLIAMRLGEPPAGYANWSLRLLRDQLIELEVVETISHESVRQTLKKTGLQNEAYSIG
jgi:transposase